MRQHPVVFIFVPKYGTNFPPRLQFSFRKNIVFIFIPKLSSVDENNSVQENNILIFGAAIYNNLLFKERFLKHNRNSYEKMTLLGTNFSVDGHPSIWQHKITILNLGDLIRTYLTHCSNPLQGYSQGLLLTQINGGRSKHANSIYNPSRYICILTILQTQHCYYFLLPPNGKTKCASPWILVDPCSAPNNHFFHVCQLQ